MPHLWCLNVLSQCLFYLCSVLCLAIVHLFDLLGRDYGSGFRISLAIMSCLYTIILCIFLCEFPSYLQCMTLISSLHIMVVKGSRVQNKNELKFVGRAPDQRCRFFHPLFMLRKELQKTSRLVKMMFRQPCFARRAWGGRMQGQSPYNKHSQQRHTGSDAPREKRAGRTKLDTAIKQKQWQYAAAVKEIEWPITNRPGKTG